MNVAPGHSGDYGYKSDTVANQIGLLHLPDTRQAGCRDTAF